MMHSQRLRSRLLVVVLCLGLASLSLLGGCGRREATTKESTQPPVSQSVANSALEVKSTLIKLGELKKNSNAEGKFTFRNTSGSTIQVNLGTPSCECLSVSLEPQAGILSSGAEGQITLKLSTARSNGGPVEGTISLSVAHSSESYRFQVAGYLQGLIVPLSYVIRPAHFKSNTIPPLRFSLVTNDSDTPFQIRSIEAYQIARERTPIESIHFHADKMIVHDPSPTRVGTDYVERRIEIPVSVTDVIDPSGSDILIKYRLGDTEGEASMKLYLLPR